MRIKLMAGNWKMHKLARELPEFFRAFAAAVGFVDEDAFPASTQVLFAVPYPLLDPATKAANSSMPGCIRIAAQNVHQDAQGAFTGEVSVPMLKDLGVGATLIGHSERRQYFGETDAAVAKKTKAVVEADMLPIVCVGETLAEREAGTTEAVVRRQVEAVLADLPNPGHLVFAYEPVWAIGTGRSATAAQAQEVHAFLRGLVRKRYGDGIADGMRLLYGGSANPANIGELMAQPDIDGALVGGASLKPDDFAKMVKAAQQAH
jgi:triosephosphate isomerase